MGSLGRGRGKGTAGGRGLEARLCGCPASRNEAGHAGLCSHPDTDAGGLYPKDDDNPLFLLVLPKRFTSRGQFIFKSLGALCSGVCYVNAG